MAAIPTSSSVPVARLRDALASHDLLAGGRGTLPPTITGIADDSRQVTAGGLFVAVRGSSADGHAFLGAAERAGAGLVLCEDPSGTALPALLVRPGDTRRAAAIAAAAFYDDPARELSLVGVTGTNGKTTTVGMTRHLLDRPDAPAASIGTLGVLVGSAGEELPGGGGLTTPGPVELQRVLRLLRDRGVRTVAMETSSHALHQRRLEGLRFDVAVFTNLTRDHLDYHGTMEEYFAAKASLVSLVRPGGTVVVNAMDRAWDALEEPENLSRLTFAAIDPEVRRGRTHADRYVADVIAVPPATVDEAAPEALDLYFNWDGRADDGSRFVLPLLGDFQIENALAAAATARALGLSEEEVAARLSTLPQVPGRLEIVHERPLVLRDYAHTPDALERAIVAVRRSARITSSQSGARRIVVVFGCGGDRDRGKRPEMGRIAERNADLAIATSDNPRTEDPERILDDVEAGMTLPHLRITDRREAIRHAMAEASPDDVIVLAGKGHEDYQVIGKTKYPFDERVIVAELAAELGLTAGTERAR